MKKRGIVAGVLVVLMLTISAGAIGLHDVTASPILTFSNGRVNCVVSISANSGSDKIEATVKLWRGNSCLRTWTASDTGTLTFNQTTPATKGETYKLIVSYTISGKVQPVKQRQNTINC